MQENGAIPQTAKYVACGLSLYHLDQFVASMPNFSDCQVLGPSFQFPRSLEVCTFALPVPWSVERFYLSKSGASGLQGSVFT